MISVPVRSTMCVAQIHASSFISCLPDSGENSSIAWSIIVFANTKCDNGGIQLLFVNTMHGGCIASDLIVVIL